MQTVEHLLLAIALLLLLSVLGSKASGRLGVPALLVFLALGMLAGSEGIGGIEFDDARIAQWLGVVTLAFILFAGGLETEWHFVRRSIWPAVSLSTIGVVVTAGVVAVFAFRFLHLTLAEGCSSWSPAATIRPPSSSPPRACRFLPTVTPPPGCW